MNRILFTKEQIDQKLDELAEAVANNYKGKELVLVGVLDGTYILMADLSRKLFKLGFDCEVYFIGLSSYGGSRESSRNPKITKDLKLDIKGRHVLIVEDVVDTGWSLDFLIRLLKERNPVSIKILVLVSKKLRREASVKLDYVGFDLQDSWIEGYGLDTDYKGRGNPDIIEKT